MIFPPLSGGWIHSWHFWKSDRNRTTYRDYSWRTVVPDFYFDCLSEGSFLIDLRLITSTSILISFDCLCYLLASWLQFLSQKLPSSSFGLYYLTNRDTTQRCQSVSSLHSAILDSDSDFWHSQECYSVCFAAFSTVSNYLNWALYLALHRDSFFWRVEPCSCSVLMCLKAWSVSVAWTRRIWSRWTSENSKLLCSAWCYNL